MQPPRTSVLFVAAGLALLAACDEGALDQSLSQGYVTECNPEQDACGGDLVCVTDEARPASATWGTCEPAFDRGYALSSPAIDVPVRKPDGSPWNVDLATHTLLPPDLHLLVRVDGVELASLTQPPYLDGALVAHAFEGAWSSVEVGEFVAQPGRQITLVALDDNWIGGDEVIMQCTVPVTAELLRSGVVECGEPWTAPHVWMQLRPIVDE